MACWTADVVVVPRVSRVSQSRSHFGFEVMRRPERVADTLREEISQIVGYELEDPRAPYVRKQLGLALNLPRTPEIHFVRDRVEEEGERVDKLLLDIERQWERGKDVIDTESE
jgi:ribosome-binding factor A